jgi:hypothetical protein
MMVHAYNPPLMNLMLMRYITRPCLQKPRAADIVQCRVLAKHIEGPGFDPCHFPNMLELFSFGGRVGRALA